MARCVRCGELHAVPPRPPQDEAALEGIDVAFKQLVASNGLAALVKAKGEGK